MGLFSKGIKLSKKTAAASLDLIKTPLPKKVALSLKQYIGEPSVSAVSIGDKVKTGQVIGTAAGEESLPLTATISGTVTDIREYPDSKGIDILSVIIESDGKDTQVKPGKGKTGISSLDPSELLERIRNAGLVTGGLLSVPLDRDLVPVDRPKTHLYLNEKEVVKKIDTLVINALDSEPSLGTNKYLSRTGSEELADGIAALRFITGAEETLFVVVKNIAPFPHLNDLVAADEEETTKIVALDGMRFPLGMPAPLLKAVLDREVTLPYGHPRDVGVALYDIDTVISAGASIRNNTPGIESLITIGGKAFRKNGVVRVRIGTTIEELVDSLGGFSKDPVKIILGGPMTGMAQYDLSVPITKDVTGLFALTEEETGLSGGYGECINCGLCVKVCPVNLIPGALSMYCAKGIFEMAEKEGLFVCIECGCCDYVCPAERPMIHLFRHAKHQLMEKTL